MPDIMTIGWIIVLISATIGFISGFFLFISFGIIGEIAGMKKAIIFLYLASLFIIAPNALIGIFGLTKYNITNIGWVIVPLLYFIAAILYIISTKTLSKSIKEISEKGIEKIKEEEIGKTR